MVNLIWGGDLVPYLVKIYHKNGLTKIEAEECIKRLGIEINAKRLEEAQKDWG